MTLRSISSSLAAILLAASGFAQSAQATLTPIRDTTLYANDSSLSNGAGSRFFAGNTFSGFTRRGLLMFDVAGALPRGSTVTSVRLELTVAQTMAPDLAVDVHRVTSDWGEAGSIAGSGQGGGALAQPGDATWSHAILPNTPWQSAGGDFVATASASTVCGRTGTFTWTSSQMVADVQGWLQSPGTQFGWIVITQESGAPTARAFHSREAVTSAVRPRLVIAYTPPAANARSVGTGCAGGGAQPLTLAANGPPTVPGPSFVLSVTGGPANALQAIDVFLDLLPTPLPLGGGCSFWGNPGTFIAGLSTTGSLPLPIPSDPALIGLSLSFQGIALAPASGAFATSNGLVLEFGV